MVARSCFRASHWGHMTGYSARPGALPRCPSRQARGPFLAMIPGFREVHLDFFLNAGLLN